MLLIAYVKVQTIGHENFFFSSHGGGLSSTIINGRSWRSMPILMKPLNRTEVRPFNLKVDIRFYKKKASASESQGSPLVQLQTIYIGPGKVLIY